MDLGIHAVGEPRFGSDWSGVAVADRYGPGLEPSSVVVGVERGGVSRAYPLSVLWYHEVVNDVVPAGSDGGTESGAEPGTPLLVTFCPLCNSGMVAERLVAGAATRFGVTGQLWQPPAVYTRAAETEGRVVGVTRRNASGDVRVKNAGNLVLYDEATGSYWSQLLARAICGPRRGERLSVVPATTATWGDWRARHPDTAVLLPPPHSTVMDPPT